MRQIALLCSVVLSCVAGGVSAEWISYGGERGTPPEVRLLSDEAAEAEIEIDIKGFELADTMVDGTVYSIVALPGHPSTMASGYPVLPMITSSIIIPDWSRMEIEIQHETRVRLTIPPVLPSRGPIRMCDNPDTIPLVRSTESRRQNPGVRIQ